MPFKLSRLEARALTTLTLLAGVAMLVSLFV